MLTTIDQRAPLAPFDQVILTEIRRITNTKRGTLLRVYPADMVFCVPCTRSVRQMRRDMVRLARLGYLERLGPRKGYRITLTLFDLSILNEIKKITNHETGIFKTVYPADMVIYAPGTRSIRQMRRYMVRLAKLGYLERLGPRKGYTLAQQYLN